jgi:hypothetical protein
LLCAIEACGRPTMVAISAASTAILILFTSTFLSVGLD